MENCNTLTITPVNGEPRIRDIDLAKRLGFDRPRDIRKLIERHLEKINEFSRCATVERRPENGGTPFVEYYLDRQQSLFICMKSETDNAFEVQVDIIRVYDAHLSGKLQPAPTIELSRMQLIEIAMEAEQERLALEQHVKVIQAKADAFDRLVTSTAGSVNLTNAAKSLQMRPRELSKRLNSMHWIYKRAGGNSWVAYQDRLEEGVLEQKITVIPKPDGTKEIREQVLVTAQGLALLAKTIKPQIHRNRT